MSASGDIERLVHSLEFENQQYVREIEKEKKLIIDMESKVEELRDGVSKENERTVQLDGDTKRFHKQFTINRSNISNLNNTLAMLSEQKDARESHLEVIQQQIDEERAKQRTTLDHYESVFKDFSEVYERSQLAEQLKGLTISKDGAQHKMQTAEREADEIKQKVQAFAQNEEAKFQPFMNTTEFILTTADSWVSTDALKKSVAQGRDEEESLKAMILHKLSIIYEKEKEQKVQQEEKQRAEIERKGRAEQEHRMRIEEQRRTEEKKKTEEARKAAVSVGPKRSGFIGIRTPTISMPSMPQRMHFVVPPPSHTPMPALYAAHNPRSFSLEIPSLSLPSCRAPPRTPVVLSRIKTPVQVKHEILVRPVMPPQRAQAPPPSTPKVPSAIMPQSRSPSIPSKTPPPRAKLSEPKTPFISCSSATPSPSSLPEKSYYSSPFNLEKIRAQSKHMFKSPGSDFGYEARVCFDREDGTREMSEDEAQVSSSFNVGSTIFEANQPTEQHTPTVDSPPKHPVSAPSSEAFNFASSNTPFGGFSGFGGAPSEPVDSSPVAFNFGGGGDAPSGGGGGGGGGGGIFGMFGGGGEEEEAQGGGGEEGGFSFSFGGGSTSPDKPGFSLF